LIDAKHRHAPFFLEARRRDEPKPVAPIHVTPAYPFAVRGSRVLSLATRLNTPAVAVGRILDNEAEWYIFKGLHDTVRTSNQRGFAHRVSMVRQAHNGRFFIRSPRPFVLSSG
jgi:hypothetical protein